MNCENYKINQGLKDKNNNNKKTKSMTCYDSVKATDSEVVRVNPYFLFYARTYKTVNVTKEVFKRMESPTLIFKNFKVKVIGDINRERVKNHFNGFKAQGLSDILSLFSTILGMTNTALKTTERFFKKINKRFYILIAKLLLEFSSFSSDFCGKRLDQFVNIVLSIYALIDHFTAEGMEAIVLAGLYPYFPSCLQALLKHIQLFSNVKITDDFTLIHQLFEKLEAFLVFILDKFGASSQLKEMVLRCFSYLGFGEKHVILDNMSKMREEADKDPKKFLKAIFKDQANDLNTRYIKCDTLADWKRKCGSVKEECEKWERFMKIVRANEDTTRQEPNLFVFEGPPNVGKSIFLNQVVSSLGWSSYGHTVPDVNEGRDFYDSYNNEDVFFMDDVGQKGVSQWRTMINMVSSVKLPLDCAEAKLKDTKFFNSHTILATTNSFMNLQGVMRNDGIADLKALWRRGFVFDFGEVKREEGVFTGLIRFLHYDSVSQQFKNEFPNYFKYKLQPTCKLDGVETLHQVRVWMGAIIKGFKIMKEKIKTSYDLTQSMKEMTIEDIDYALDLYHEPKAQGFFTSMVTGAGIYYGLLTAHRIAALLYSEFLDWRFIFDRDYVDDPNIDNETKNNIDREQENLVMAKAETYTQLLMGLGLIGFCYSIYLGIQRVTSSEKAENWNDSQISVFRGQGLNLSGDFAKVHNSVKLVKDHLFECDLQCGDEKVSCCVLVSGRLLILPDHMNLGPEMKIKIFKDRSLDHVLIEWMSITVLYSNSEEDVCLFELPLRFPNPFKSLSNWIGKDVNSKEEEFLVTPWGFHVIKAGSSTSKVIEYTFKTQKQNRVLKTTPDYYVYDVQNPGMCGSPIFSVKRGIVGFHVAGCHSQGLGIGSNWSKEVITVIRHFIEEDKPLVSVPHNISEKVLRDCSVCKLDNGSLISVTPDVSNIEPSALYGIYPVDRHPANLQIYGTKTLNVIATKSFKPCSTFSSAELVFAQKVLDEIVSPFDDLTDSEVIKGTDYLARLNPKSSNGFGCFKEKERYINFEKGELTELFAGELKEIEKDAREGNVDYKKLLWFECLKDEIRNCEKEGVPRSFRVGTIHQQFLMKKYFGRMVESIMKNRAFNKIMVGCNPIQEWPNIYTDLMSGDIFAGDIKNWDGGMNPMLQEMIAKTLFEKSSKSNPNLIQALVGTLTNSVVVVNKDLYITTHSMPSGSYLTAIVNSIVNKLYTAIWYYRNVDKPTTLGYWTDVSDYVYGDDKLNVVRNHREKLNAITMEAFFKDVGLGFTDAHKGIISTPFQDVSEVSFLKRSFVYHPLIKKVVCPLELRVIQNTLSYYDSSKEHSVVIRDKLLAVQRELFLHTDYEPLLHDLYFRLQKYKVPLVKIPFQVLLSYFTDENCEVPLSFSTNLYL